MPVLLSNQLKALLVVEDITEQGVNVWRDNCFVIQHFHYDCHRRRNDAGEPYGPTVPAYLSFTVRVTSDNNGKILFERMQSHDTFPYSFLFNATFNASRRLSECQDAMVVTGYVVDVEETYESALSEDGEAEQMLIHAKILMSNIKYLGRERYLQLTMTND